MKTIKFTYVDSGTQVSIEKAPAKNGPWFPRIKGLVYQFALERYYPTNVPYFIGTCDDDADLSIDGFIQEMTEEEVLKEQEAEKEAQASRVRYERQLMLQASDWTQVADAPVDQEAWATYRQALRDITDQQGFPWNVTWPSKPE